MEYDEYEDYEDMALVADTKRYIILVIYDIVENKRRNRMVAALEKYGIRVQKSAFEAYITKKQYEKMEKEITPLIDIEEDSLRIYFLAKHTSVRSWGIGDKHVEDIIVF